MLTSCKDTWKNFKVNTGENLPELLIKLTMVNTEQIVKLINTSHSLEFPNIYELQDNLKLCKCSQNVYHSKDFITIIFEHILQQIKTCYSP